MSLEKRCTSEVADDTITGNTGGNYSVNRVVLAMIPSLVLPLKGGGAVGVTQFTEHLPLEKTCSGKSKTERGCVSSVIGIKSN